jgi:2-polyprenyl-6-hydroxyphenyl methylase / 3-demethylubiquinone-9 3-methyltransferase
MFCQFTQGSFALNLLSMATAIATDIYNKIDNDLYNQQDDIWWDEDSVLYMLKTSVNPCRFPYYLNTYKQTLRRDPVNKTALDIGSGGGILAEEFAAAGFKVTGIDPSENSLKTAIGHAKFSGLNIDYQPGTGEHLQFVDHSFDVVYCCDVLEHVRDLPKCISEISRVLKPGGVFFYDTFNRNFLSKLIVIKVWQEWKRTAFMPPNLHVYEMLIKPKELEQLMLENGLGQIKMRGMAPNVSPVKMISLLMKRAKGQLTYAQLGSLMKLKESNDMKVGYMGFAIKK